MNWTRVVIGGVVAGVVMNIAGFVQHGMIMSGTYTKYDQVFAQEQANPAFFVLLSVILGLVAAVLFGKTRSAWGAGLVGGLKFGLLIALLPGFTNFYWPMVIDSFPYHLAWCWLGIDVITYGLGGAALGLIIKSE